MIALFRRDYASDQERILLIVVNAVCFSLIVGAFVYSWVLFQPAVVHFLEHQATLPTTCFFKIFTHLPCPTCGMTRAMVMIVRGNFLEAFHFNILSIPLFLTAAGFGVLSLFKPEQSLALLRKIGAWRGLAVLFASLMVAWIVKMMGPQMYW